MENIRIGTLVRGVSAHEVIPQIVVHGFESFSLTYWQNANGIDLAESAKLIKDALADKDVIISALSVFGNPLITENGNQDTIGAWEQLIDNAHLFGTDMVTGFTGRIPNKPIDESMPRFKEVFSELTRRAKDKGVKIAFENCDMGGTWLLGDWNIAQNPTAWEMMFNEVPMDNIGLEWEPCHQMVSLIDPIPQLKKWVNKIFHVHGKDATIDWNVIREFGIHGPNQFAWHRSPGFGDSNWTDIISILRQNGYKGTIDIEGWHDPVYRNDLEMTGQVHALNYLKNCRGGSYVPNPTIKQDWK